MQTFEWSFLGVHMTQAKGKEKELFAAQAAKDWLSDLALLDNFPGNKVIKLT